MLSIDELHERILYPVVRVRAKNAGGSGVLVYSKPDPKDPKKYINVCLTAEHVISDLIKIKEEWDPVLKRDVKTDHLEEAVVEVFDYDGSYVVSANATPAEIIAYDKAHDLAALRLRTPRPMVYVATIIPEAEIANLQLFEPVWTCGCSLLHDPFANPGTLTYLREMIEQKEYIMSNSAGVFGNSGGGLFRGKDGTLLGLVCRLTGIQLGFGIDLMCYDDQTEVLTDQGWMPFRQLTGNEKLATRAPNGDLEYHRPLRLVALPYTGKMIHFRSRSFDLCVTPNHNMLLLSRRSGRPYFRQAEELQAGQYLLTSDARWHCIVPASIEIPAYINQWTSGRGHRIVRFYTVAARPVPVEPWLRFLGYYLAEGSIGYQNGRPVSVVLSQSPKSPHYTRMVKTIEELGFRPHCYGRQIVVHNVALALHMTRYGDAATTKHLTDYEKSLHPQLLGVLLDAMLDGDGHRYRRHACLITTSKTLADDVQEIAMKAGLAARIYEVRPPAGAKRYSSRRYFRVTLTRRTRHYLRPRFHRREVPYSGMVYCAIVPHHTLFVRRNGKAVWCGNTWMIFSTHPRRLYEFMRHHELHFLFDDSDDYYAAAERREKRRKESLRELLLGEGEAKKK
jgi:hypothetical protein